VRRAWVNNGGDIALHLTPGERFRVGLFADLAGGLALPRQGLEVDGVLDVADSPVRGVATSGWRGRSFSLGIADSVTVLAATAAQADAAATVVGNAVQAGTRRSCARRHAACATTATWAPPVTVQVGALTPARPGALRQGLQKR
jgi:ApbE superfamily uncharacterized protein (UPF0280 family)